MFKILSQIQIRSLDAYTLQHTPIASIDLMERACLAFVQWFVQRFDSSKKVGIICGTGNNGARDAYHMSLAHKMDHLTLKAAFTQAGETDNVADTGATHWAVGAAYALSKTTEVSFVYSMVSNDPAGRYGVDRWLVR